MDIKRTICAICAWRKNCKKKFSMTANSRCVDFVRDLTIPEDKELEEKETHERENKKGS